MSWLSKLWQKTKEVATRYTGTFIVVMFLNQLLFFGLCLKPVCLIAAMPHVLLITVVIGTWLNIRETKRKKALEKDSQTSYQPKTATRKPSYLNIESRQPKKPTKKIRVPSQPVTGVLETVGRSNKKLDNFKSTDGSSGSKRPAVNIKDSQPNSVPSKFKQTVDISKLIESNKAKLQEFESLIKKTTTQEKSTDTILNIQKNTRPDIKLANKKQVKDVSCPRCFSKSCFKNGKSESGASQFKCLTCFFIFSEKDIGNKSLISPDLISDENRKNIDKGDGLSPAFTEFGVTSIWHMTHIDNVKNILQHGILSNSLAHSQYSPTDISNADVQVYRKKQEPMYRRKLHDYVPTYISIKNPMLFAIKDLSKQLCLLEIDTSAIRVGQFLLSDGNAASRDTTFYTDLRKLNRLPWDVINSDYWSEYNDGKRKKCAEVLIYPKIESRFIKAIHCNSIFTKRVLERMSVSFSPIQVSPDLFFK